MEQCRYVLLESRLDGRIYCGIAAVADYDGTVVILQSYVDLCAERNATAEFVNLCNAQQLSLCHLPDAVDDFMANL